MKRPDFSKKNIGLLATGLNLAGFFSHVAQKNCELLPLLVEANGKPIICVRWATYRGVVNPNPSVPRLKALEEDRPTLSGALPSGKA